MRTALQNYIQNISFPCIMAKAVASKGYLQEVELNSLNKENDIKHFLKSIYSFINHYRDHSDILHSFTLIIKNKKCEDFEIFENYFWKFLSRVNSIDKLSFLHDPRVSSHSKDPFYSFSIKSEAFFILALHPDSPRWSRRFKFPAIVFNPHQQFEKLRHNNTFMRIRDVIRKNDKRLQGSINPMVHDFGEKSEIYQYIGRSYNGGEVIPFIQ